MTRGLGFIWCSIGHSQQRGPDACVPASFVKENYLIDYRR